VDVCGRWQTRPEARSFNSPCHCVLRAPNDGPLAPALSDPFSLPCVRHRDSSKARTRCEWKVSSAKLVPRFAPLCPMHEERNATGEIRGLTAIPNPNGKGDTISNGHLAGSAVKLPYTPHPEEDPRLRHQQNLPSSPARLKIAVSLRRLGERIRMFQPQPQRPLRNPLQYLTGTNL
jgi:hypothetical protein